MECNHFPCPSQHGNLTLPPLTLEHGLIITRMRKLWLHLLIHGIILILSADKNVARMDLSEVSFYLKETSLQLGRLFWYQQVSAKISWTSWWNACIIITLCSHYIHTLRWRHNVHDGVSNHQPYDCLLNRLLGHRSKKTSKFRVTCLWAGNHPRPVNSPHKWPVTRKMFPFDEFIMQI